MNTSIIDLTPTKTTLDIITSPMKRVLSAYKRDAKGKEVKRVKVYLKNGKVNPVLLRELATSARGKPEEWEIEGNLLYDNAKNKLVLWKDAHNKKGKFDYGGDEGFSLIGQQILPKFESEDTSAFKDYVTMATLQPRITTPNIEGLESLFNLKGKIRSILAQRREKGIKTVRFHLYVWLKMVKKQGERVISEQDQIFSGPALVLSSPKGIDGAVNKTIAHLNKKIEEYNSKGSGWIC